MPIQIQEGKKDQQKKRRVKIYIFMNCWMFFFDGSRVLPYPDPHKINGDPHAAGRQGAPRQAAGRQVPGRKQDIL
jgi:hypothetical protein